MSTLIELTPPELRRVCDPQSLGFESTADLPTLGEVLGQPRAVAAFEFGTGIASHGFNIFALGQPGSGKTTLIRDYLERRALGQPSPPDLCYVNNFADGRCPVPLRLPTGRGAGFKIDIDALLEELKTEIPKAFESSEYSSLRDKIMQEMAAKRGMEIEQIEHRASRAGFQLLKGAGRSPTGAHLRR